MNSRLAVRLGLDEDELPPSRAVPVTTASLRLIADWIKFAELAADREACDRHEDRAVLGQHQVNHREEAALFPSGLTMG